MQAIHRKQSSKADKKEGTHHQRTRAGIQAGPEAPRADHLPQVDTPKDRHGTHHRAPSLYLFFKISLIFALSCLRKSRENTKHPQKIIYFCPFLPCLPENLPRWEGMKKEGREGIRLYMGAYNKGHPPPLFGEQKRPLPP